MFLNATENDYAKICGTTCRISLLTNIDMHARTSIDMFHFWHQFFFFEIVYSHFFDGNCTELGYFEKQSYCEFKNRNHICERVLRNFFFFFFLLLFCRKQKV